MIGDILPEPRDNDEVAVAASSEGADNLEMSEATKPTKSVHGPDRLIIILLIVFILRGLIYATIVPLWTAPDEPAHFQSAERVAKQLNPKYKTSSFYGKGSAFYSDRPQSYYWLAGSVLSSMPNSDAGTRALALRLLSIILNTGAIYFTYRMARELFPQERLVYLSAPMAMAMLPMFTFNGMSINSDNAAIVISCLFLWLAVRTIARGYSISTTLLMLAAIVTALFTKRTTAISGLLLAILPLFMMFRIPAKPGSRRLVRLLPVLLIPAFFIIALPLISRLAPTFTGEYSLLGPLQRVLDSDVEQLFLAPAASLISSFWAHFGWMDIPRAGGYADLQKFWYLPLVGYLIILMSRFRYQRSVLDRVQLIGLAFLSVAVVSVVSITLMYATAKGYAPELWSPQARYVWPIVGAGSLLFAAGSLLGVRSLVGIAVSSGLKVNLERLGGWVGVIVFIGLGLSIFYFDFSSLRSMIIPRYYSQFDLAGAILRDSVSTDHPSMQTVFAHLQMSSEETRRQVLWRPKLLELGLVHYAIFACYGSAFISFLVGAVWRERAETS